MVFPGDAFAHLGRFQVANGLSSTGGRAAGPVSAQGLVDLGLGERDQHQPRRTGGASLRSSARSRASASASAFCAFFFPCPLQTLPELDSVVWIWTSLVVNENFRLFWPVHSGSGQRLGSIVHRSALKTCELTDPEVKQAHHGKKSFTWGFWLIQVLDIL